MLDVAGTLPLVESFKVNYVQAAATRIEALCAARQFQAMQDELAAVLNSVPFPQVIRHFARVVEFHIHQTKFKWTLYIGLVSILHDTARTRVPDIDPQDLVPEDVLRTATLVFLRHLSRRPEHMHATLAWCRLYQISTADLSAGALDLLDVDPKIGLDFCHDLNLMAALPADDVMRLLLQRNDIHGVDRFVHGDPARQRALIHLMIALRVDDKLIKKRLSKFNLPPDDFPVFVQRRRRATIRYLVRAQQYGDIPQAVGDDLSSRLYACNFVYEQCGFDNPVTQHLVHSLGVGSSFPDVLPPHDASFDIGGNKDAPPPLPGFLTLAALGLTAPPHFLDTPADVSACITRLLAEPVVGLDCEWRSAFSLNETTPCALLQLASATHTYVVDMLASGMLPLVLPLFAAPHVIKVGLAVRGDFAALGVTRVVRVVDLQALEKSVHAVTTTSAQEGARASLSDLCVKYLGLPLDKRARMSNWERRPLTQPQLEYAALDAAALVHILDAMKQHVGDAVVAACVNRVVYDINGARHPSEIAADGAVDE
ncbi:Aste57867_5580 [Aphanomyces stellatus]|uniref:Aste57867_5580 protein n=1 Tax=Aphanomyces stellatus TaxID=120398 RepID=A0A485KHF7_9STRA|nr:hypothetical protein As57867_005567 [Aphanomyces stellatus]VFT82626.1 Aste57867_5580 [Aphanomyces stellatus]